MGVLLLLSSAASSALFDGGARPPPIVDPADAESPSLPSTRPSSSSQRFRFLFEQRAKSRDKRSSDNDDDDDDTSDNPFVDGAMTEGATQSVWPGKVPRLCGGGGGVEAGVSSVDGAANRRSLSFGGRTVEDFDDDFGGVNDRQVATVGGLESTAGSGGRLRMGSEVVSTGGGDGGGEDFSVSTTGKVVPDSSDTFSNSAQLTPPTQLPSSE